MSNTHLKWIVVLAIIFVTTISLIWYFLKPVTQAPIESKAIVNAPIRPAPPSANTTIITDQQNEAATAAAKQINVKPIVDSVNQKPDFVSEIEWQSLKIVAQNNPDPDHELTRLVSNLRFNKQMEIWKSLSNDPDSTERHALATQLLNDIPNAVTNQAIDKAEAQEAQIALLTDLVTDPHTRQQRISQEAARIGVRLDVEESKS